MLVATLSLAAAHAVVDLRDRHVFLDPGLGYAHGDGEKDGRFFFGASAYGVVGPVAIGGQLDAAPGLFSSGRFGMGAALGLHVVPGDHLRLALLGELGWHLYTNLGSSIFTEGRDSATVPYAGGRFIAAAHMGRRFSIGLAVVYRNDFARPEVQYTTRGGLFCQAPCVSTNKVRIGEASLGGFLSFGVSW